MHGGLLVSSEGGARHAECMMNKELESSQGTVYARHKTSKLGSRSCSTSTA